MFGARRHSLMTLFSMTACVLSLAMLLLFPASSARRFDPHFRNPRVRRSIERHTFVAASSHNLEESASQPAILPKFFAPVEVPAIGLVGDCYLDSSREVEPFRRCSRLKLGPSRSNRPDPLIAA